MVFRKREKVCDSPILVMDALGFSEEIRRADDSDLMSIWRRIEGQYYRFKAKVPHKWVFVSTTRVWGSAEFETLRLNDMFILYSRRTIRDPALRYLVSTSLLYQAMLLERFIPRGGLGFGSIIGGEGLLIGNGFIDAYEQAEKRSEMTKDICAVEVSRNFLSTIPNSRHILRLLCFYKGRFFVHPYLLNDPDMGEFDRDRVLGCLKDAGANETKLTATARFLDEMEDYEDASQQDSKSREFVLKAKGSM